MAAGVPVPETAVNEHDALSTRKNDVRFSGQICAMKRESASETVQD